MTVISRAKRFMRRMVSPKGAVGGLTPNFENYVPKTAQHDIPSQEIIVRLLALRLQPELDQPADGFRAARQIFLLAAPVVEKLVPYLAGRGP